MTTASSAAHDVVTMIDLGLRRNIRVSQPEGEQHARAFPVPSLEADGLSPLSVDVLHTHGTTVDQPDERWHVKLYRCSTPETAVALEMVLREQADLVRAANSAYTNTYPRDRCRWAVVPFSVAVHGDAGDAATGTRYDATPDEVRSHPSAQIASWFGDGEAIQAERCIVVVSRFLDPAGWHREVGLAIDELQHFESMARGLDVLHRTGAAHCDVKPSNVRRFDHRATRRYVLVDGDSVIGSGSAPGRGDLRHTNLPPQIRQALDDGRRLGADELEEIDRFGFVMLVLAALTDEDCARQFLVSPDPDDVRAQLLSRASEHPDVADAFARVLQPGALSASGWTAAGWLDDLRKAAGRTPATDVDGRDHAWNPGPDIEELRRRLRDSGPFTAHDVQSELLRAMAEQARDVQRRAKLHQLRWVVAVCLLLLGITVVWVWQVS